MATNFASSKYASAFSGLPVPDTAALRQGALDYLEKFDTKVWYDDPVSTVKFLPHYVDKISI